MFENNNNATNELSLIDCSIKSLKDVPLRPNLTSINLHSNQLIKIENLTFLQNLLYLDLSSNQINSLSGLECLVSLQTLNLSCNRINVVDGLHGLKKLKYLNISHNRVQYLNGFHDLHGFEYKLETLLLHGNSISSIDEVLHHLSGLTNLKNLTLYENPISRINNYQLIIRKHLKQIVNLDSKEHFNIDFRSLPGFEQYEEYLNSDSSSSDIVNHQNFDDSDKYNSFQIDDDVYRTIFRSEDDTEDNFDRNSLKQTIEQENNLNKLELQIQKLISVRNLLHNQIKSDNQNEVKEQQPLITKQTDTKVKDINKAKQQKTINLKNVKQTKSNSILKTSETNTDNSLIIRKDSSTQTDCDYENEVNKKYEEEKERRIKLENEMDRVKSNIEQLKIKNRTEYMNNEKAQNYQQMCVNEKKKNEDLISKLNHYQHVICDMKRQMESYKESQQANMNIIKQLESNITCLNQIKDENEAKCKMVDENNRLLKSELETLRQSYNSSQSQLQKLQDLFLTNETKYKKDSETYVNINGEEVKRVVKCEIERVQQLHTLELKQHIEKIETLTKEYKALEDEFRLALIIESNRYSDLHTLFERINRDALQFKQDLQQCRQREERDKTLIVELNGLIKEQKTRLQELTKYRQEASENAKKQNEKLEQLVDESRKYKIQIETSKKQMKEYEARTHALESLLDGLRKEKQLWSQELVQQGSSLAQDRGRLEVQIQTLQSELNTMKKLLDRETDNVKIKTKIIEDQTDSVKKLKDAILERDEALKKCREEALSMQKSLEKQLAEEIALTQEIQDKYNKSLERRDELKLQLSESQQQCEKLQTTYNELSKKWKEKGEMIDGLDFKVRNMKENYDTKEKILIDEKNKLLEENKQLQTRVRHIDDEFRRQFDIAQKEYQEQIDKLKYDYEKKIQELQFKVAEVEEEMRILLIENEQNKKQYEEKLKKLSKAFSELQFEFK